MNAMNDADDAEVMDELTSIRRSIDNIDAALVHLLAERFKFTQKVGKLKAAAGMPPSDPTRERVQTLLAAARRIEESRISVADLGVRRPSLDDVFLALTATGVQSHTTARGVQSHTSVTRAAEPSSLLEPRRATA